jgi:malonyl-CoA O-methyltransferase
MNGMDIVLPQKKQVARAFGLKASKYDCAALIQRRIIERLCEYLPAGLIQGPWLDAGSGTGLLADILGASAMPDTLVCADLSFDSLKLLTGKKRSACRAVAADVEGLPFSPGVFACVVTSSVLHWLHDRDTAARELGRVLKSGGNLVFAAFLDGSFRELCALRQQRGLSLPVRFFSEKDLHAMIKKCGLLECRYAAMRGQYYFPSAMDALKYLSDIGSTAAAGPRLAKKEIADLCREYEDRFGTEKGVPITCNVALGVAKKE